VRARALMSGQTVGEKRPGVARLAQLQDHCSRRSHATAGRRATSL